LGTVGLAAFQSFGVASMLQTQGGRSSMHPAQVSCSAVVGLTAGTHFLMWLGEQITERGIGNGISLIIFAGIVAGLPTAIVHTLGMANSGELTGSS
jgi:preprotein translocase subunit SecY